MKNKDFFLLMTFTLFTLFANAQIINMNPDPNGEPWIAGGLPEITPEIQAKIDAIPEMVLSTISSSIELPVVDNSLNIFMRPIFLQSDNSCAQASGVGYDFTYEINRVRNIPSNVDVNQYPTHYTWNFLNGGGDNGSWYYYGWDIIKENGCPNVPTWGGMAGDLKRWMTGYDNYYSGMFNKVDSYWSINLGTPDGLETFKHWINDHNVGADIGGLGCFSIYMSGVEYGTLPPASAEAGKHIIADFHYDTGGSHAMTFVGYNDEILDDINGDGLFTNNLDTNEDGLIDMLDWEIGALKIANSWNTGWPFPIDGGYSYIPYRLLPKKVYNPVNPLQSMYVITGKKTYVLVAKEEYSPELTIKGEVDYLCRGKLDLKWVMPIMQTNRNQLNKLI